MFNLKNEIDLLLINHKFLIDTKDLYLVGGCVRDLLHNKIFDTNKEIRDLDFLVTNYSQEDLLKLGFEQVGASFPVFLEPNTKEEYALPRKEIKTGVGYKEFSFETENVSIIDDLYRRDITINAMCINIQTGDLIDPFKGIEHIVSKEIEMVSKNSFIEDPLRTLRACRFAAIFNAQITDNTKEAILLLVNEPNQTELRSLAKERLLLEFTKVLKVNQLDNFINQINETQLNILYPFLNENLKKLGNIYNGNIDYTLAYIKYLSDNKLFNLPISSDINDLNNFLKANFGKLSNLNDSKNLFDLINKSKLRHNDENLIGFIEYLNDIKVIKINYPKLLNGIEAYKKIDFKEIVQVSKNNYNLMNTMALDVFETNLNKEKEKTREI